MNIIIANSNAIHEGIEKELKQIYSNIHFIHKKEELEKSRLDPINPQYVFFIHWSYIIPKEIYEKYCCIVFHMTDLPFGRGGSPLQNLIANGLTETKLSALKVEAGLDTGSIFLKKKLSLFGTAEEIFLRAGKIMIEMIEEIIDNNIVPTPQEGDPLVFKRRNPSESNIEAIEDFEKIFDYIRMLDAEGYPKAFIETKYFKYEFSRASLKKDSIIADVRITKK